MNREAPYGYEPLTIDLYNQLVIEIDKIFDTLTDLANQAKNWKPGFFGTILGKKNPYLDHIIVLNSLELYTESKKIFNQLLCEDTSVERIMPALEVARDKLKNTVKNVLFKAKNLTPEERWERHNRVLGNYLSSATPPTAPPPSSAPKAPPTAPPPSSTPKASPTAPPPSSTPKASPTAPPPSSAPKAPPTASSPSMGTTYTGDLGKPFDTEDISTKSKPLSPSKDNYTDIITYLIGYWTTYAVEELGISIVTLAQLKKVSDEDPMKKAQQIADDIHVLSKTELENPRFQEYMERGRQILSTESISTGRSGIGEAGYMSMTPEERQIVDNLIDSYIEMTQDKGNGDKSKERDYIIAKFKEMFRYKGLDRINSVERTLEQPRTNISARLLKSRFIDILTNLPPKVESIINFYKTLLRENKKSLLLDLKSLSDKEKSRILFTN